MNGNKLAHVAQSVEHFLGKEEVSGSNPDVGSTKALRIRIGPLPREFGLLRAPEICLEKRCRKRSFGIESE